MICLNLINIYFCPWSKFSNGLWLSKYPFRMKILFHTCCMASRLQICNCSGEIRILSHIANQALAPYKSSSRLTVLTLVPSFDHLPLVFGQVQRQTLSTASGILACGHSDSRQTSRYGQSGYVLGTFQAPITNLLSQCICRTVEAHDLPSIDMLSVSLRGKKGRWEGGYLGEGSNAKRRWTAP